MQLQELKNAYDSCRLALEKYHSLLEERERLYEQITSKNDRENLPFLKAELKLLDHALDGLGEQHEERLATLKQALIEGIQRTHPSSQSLYQEITSRLASFQQEESHLLNLNERLRPFQSALNEGAVAQRPRGLLALLFGRNEKVRLAQAIRKGAIEANRVSPHIEDEKIRHFLATFIKEADRPWNGKLYKEHFYELHGEFAHLMNEVEEKLTQSRRGSYQADKEIENWIEKYSAS